MPRGCENNDSRRIDGLQPHSRASTFPGNKTSSAGAPRRANTVPAPGREIRSQDQFAQSFQNRTMNDDNTSTSQDVDLGMYYPNATVGLAWARDYIIREEIWLGGIERSFRKLKREIKKDDQKRGVKTAESELSDGKLVVTILFGSVITLRSEWLKKHPHGGIETLSHFGYETSKRAQEVLRTAISLQNDIEKRKQDAENPSSPLKKAVYYLFQTPRPEERAFQKVGRYMVLCEKKLDSEVKKICKRERREDSSESKALEHNLLQFLAWFETLADLLETVLNPESTENVKEYTPTSRSNDAIFLLKALKKLPKPQNPSS